MNNFADRLADATRSKGCAVCVGIDPRIAQLPSEFRPAKNSPKAHADSIGAWTRALVDVVAPLVPVVKPNLAFFEALGAAGFAVYHELVIAAQEKGLLVIADAKRGDMGSTAAAYAEAHFEVIGADALTINPYLGRDSIEPFTSYAKMGKGVFVLVKTSNPGSADLQDLSVGDVPLYRHVARIVHEMGAENGAMGTWRQSAVGAVVGATHPRELIELRKWMPSTPFLVPGYGAQGGTAADCAPAFLPDGTGAIVNSSRGITFAFRSGDHAAKYGDVNWRESVKAAVIEMRDALAAARDGNGKA
jgi:orotidine-5'-phosphate decarboxylase